MSIKNLNLAISATKLLIAPLLTICYTSSDERGTKRQPKAKGGFPINKYTRLNDQIRVSQVRLVDENGGQIGIIDTKQALAKARSVGLDLVEVAPEAKPPVAKIIDWGKYQYQQTKLAQKAKKKQKVQDIKQMRFGLKIGEHDMNIKLKKVREFLEDGDKVKLSVVFKGREITHKELGYLLVDKITQLVEDIAVMDQQPQLSGRFLTFVLRKK